MTWNHIIWFVIGISTTLGIINLCGYHIPWLVVFLPIIFLLLGSLTVYLFGKAVEWMKV